ncbi:MAG: Hpt domain-containing protein [Burkholderiales bacterium]|nr:Hpt domain-containing protein [Burkholderiales bacterium]
MSSPPPDPAATPGTVLDEAALARLRELDPAGQHGVVVRVLATYETSLVRQLGQMRAELDAPRAKVLGDLAHTLKSSSASVGALALSRACEALEQRMRQGAQAQTHDVAELIALGEAALVAVRTILRG